MFRSCKSSRNQSTGLRLQPERRIEKTKKRKRHHLKREQNRAFPPCLPPTSVPARPLKQIQHQSLQEPNLFPPNISPCATRLSHSRLLPPTKKTQGCYRPFYKESKTKNISSSQSSSKSGSTSSSSMGTTKSTRGSSRDSSSKHRRPPLPTAPAAPQTA